jgi:predicted Fe-S protein YdhL (DUF1289 family)
VEEIGTQHPVYLFPCRVETAKSNFLSGISKDFDVCKACSLQIHDEIKKYINMSDNKKNPITFLIQKYKSETQSKMKDRIRNIIVGNKEKTARIESGGHPELMDKFPQRLWQQEMHYFIVEKILSIGICRMDVIFKAIQDGVLHVPQSYTMKNNKKQFIKKYIFSLLDEFMDRKFVDFIVPAWTASAGTDATAINYNHGALVYTGVCSTLLSGRRAFYYEIYFDCIK